MSTARLVWTFVGPLLAPALVLGVALAKPWAPAMSPDQQAEIGLALVETGDAGRGQAMIANALARDPGAPQALVNSGLLAMHAGQLDQARAMFEKALARQPKSFDARINLGKIYQKRHQLDQAMTMLKDLRTDYPKDPRAAYVLGAVAIDRRDFATARASFQDYLALAPDAPDRFDVRKLLNQLGVPNEEFNP